MRVLVTGADGYVGSVLCPLLEAEGIDYSGVDTGYYRGCGWTPRSWDRVSRRDILDLTEKDLAGFDAICHLAAISNDPMGDLSGELIRRVNLDGSVRLARAARRAGVRLFLFSGSCSVYGRRGDRPLTEADPTEPRTAYARSKVEAEEEILKIASRDFSVIVLRNATAYGESLNLRLDLVVNDLAAHAFAEKRILIKSDGTPWRPVIHVEDMARAFIAFLESDHPALSGEIINVGSAGQNYRVSDIAREVGEAFAGCPIEYSPNPDTDSRSYRVDFSKLQQALPDFRCRREVAETARTLAEVFRGVGLDAASIASPRFIRLKALKQELGL